MRKATIFVGVSSPCPRLFEESGYFGSRKTMGCMDFPRYAFNAYFIIPLVLRRGEPALIYHTSCVPVFYHNLDRGLARSIRYF